VKLAPYVEDFGPFWWGDTPTEPLSLEFIGEDDTVVEAPADVIEAWLVNPNGIASQDFSVLRAADPDGEPADEPVELTWPDVALVPGGIWQLVARVGGRRLPSLRFVVQYDDGWHSLDSARDEWIEARQLTDVQLYQLLSASRTQCIEYGPDLPVEGGVIVVPTHYRLAQLMQARALWQSMRANADPSAEGDFAVPTFPMDWTVRGLLRPRNPKAR